MERKTLLSLVLALLLALPVIGTALAAPPVPASYYGTVTVNGANLLDGSQVTAWVNGTQYATTSTQTYNGNSVYGPLDVPGDDPDTSEVEGAVAGDIIVFQVDGQEVDQTATWQSGGGGELNLTADTATPPSAIFSCTPLSGSAPLLVSCTDASTGNITDWSWDFGDGTTSTDQNPSHTYNAGGAYTIALTVTGDDGSDTETRTSYISVDGNNASCDVGDDNACVLARGDVFPTIQNIIFDSFVLDGQRGTTSANSGGNVSDNDITDAGWSIYVTAEGPFTDENSHQIPIGNEDDLTVECLTIETTDGQAAPTCHTASHVRLVSDTNKTTMISASPGTGTGIYQFTTQFVLTIPSQTVPGNYTTTVYIDRQIGSGGP